MLDDTTTTPAGPDRGRIDLTDDDQVRRWCESCQASVDQLRDAVATVGDRAAAVREYLAGRRL